MGSEMCIRDRPVVIGGCVSRVVIRFGWGTRGWARWRARRDGGDGRRDRARARPDSNASDRYRLARASNPRSRVRRPSHRASSRRRERDARRARSAVVSRPPVVSRAIAPILVCPIRIESRLETRIHRSRPVEESLDPATRSRPRARSRLTASSSTTMGDSMGASDAAAGSKIFVGGLDRTVDEGAPEDDGGRARARRDDRGIRSRRRARDARWGD